MRKTFIFRALCMVMTWVYCSVAAQAGQVVGQKERAWAKTAVSMPESDKNLTPVSASNTIAVLQYANKTGLEDLNVLQKGLAIMLTADLTKVQKLQVVERNKVQALLEEMHLDATGVVDPATVPKVGKMLGAYYVSTGDITMGKMTEININPLFIDVPFETVTAQAATSGSIQNLFRMEKDILFSIIKQMKVFLSSKEKEELQKPFAATTGAALAFFAGVDASDKGRYADAAKMYEKAVAEDKNFTPAKDALQELQMLGLTGSGPVASLPSPKAQEAVEAGSSTGNVTMIALGVVAAGGVALALAGGGGGGGGSTTTSTDTSTDTKGPVIVSTDPKENEALNTCLSGTISYTFDETIQNCSAVIFPDGWMPYRPTARDKVLSVSYYGPASVCSGDSVSVKTTVSGCQDAKGNTMTKTDVYFKSK